MSTLRGLWRLLLASTRDMAPIVLVIAFFQVVVLQQPFPNLDKVIIGLVFVIVGLTLFVQGLETGLFPIGEAMADAFAHKGSLIALLAFAFCLGFGTTVAEPALIAVAAEAGRDAGAAGAIADTAEARDGYALSLPMTVALSVGAALVLGVFRILKGWPIQYLIIGGYVLVGLTFFLVGLEQALFPLGETMASQLTAPEFVRGAAGVGDGAVQGRDYLWVYVFAAAIGFSTTIVEPSLIAVALKAEEISGGSIGAFGLRIAVAVGVAAGVAIGAYRIVSGTPLPYYIMAGYVVVILQTLRASKFIIPLAYDSGGVTTSTVPVPVVAALGLGLASTIPGRSPLIDGFGLIAFASVFPVMSVMGYAMLTSWLRAMRKGSGEGTREKEKAP